MLQKAGLHFFYFFFYENRKGEQFHFKIFYPLKPKLPVDSIGPKWQYAVETNSIWPI